MYSDPTSYYYESVKPNYEAYRSASQANILTMGTLDLRNAALLSTGSLFHFRDYLKPILGGHFTRDFVGQLCPDYHLLGDVFNASKHAILNRKNKLIEASTSIAEGALITRFMDENGKYSHHQSLIFVIPIRKQNDPIDLLGTNTNVYNFWTKFLYEKSFIENPEFYQFAGNDIILNVNTGLDLRC